jgi:hypothetical protein
MNPARKSEAREPAPSFLVLFSITWEAAMQISEIYRRRAAECERLALKNPNESAQLKQVAQTWRWLAAAADELTEAEKTLH